MNQEVGKRTAERRQDHRIPLHKLMLNLSGGLLNFSIAGIEIIFSGWMDVLKEDITADNQQNGCNQVKKEAKMIKPGRYHCRQCPPERETGNGKSHNSGPRSRVDFAHQWQTGNQSEFETEVEEKQSGESPGY